MSDTLPRRGIEDSMWPKPQETDRLHFRALFGRELGAMFEAFYGPGISGTSRVTRRTVTVLVQFDPDDISAETVTKEVLEQLKDGHGRPWHGIRSHLWDSNVGWEVPGA